MRALIALYAIALIAAMPAEAKRRRRLHHPPPTPRIRPPLPRSPRCLTDLSGTAWVRRLSAGMERSTTINPAHVHVPIMAAFGSGCLDASSP